MVAGNIGSSLRMEYSVIGLGVNVASRLCDHARAGQILSGSEVYEELKGKFKFMFVERTRFKGISTQIDVHEVVGPPGTRLRQIQEGGPSKSERVDLTIPMAPKMELVAAEAAAALGELIGLEGEKVEEVKVSLIESCINTFEHSNSKDARLKLDFDITDDNLIITITDRGSGFDVEAAERKRKRRRTKAQRRGWGLTLIHELMDEVEIESDSNGTTVTMSKKR